MWPNDFPDLFETMTFSLEPGALFCLFTDGLTEALNKYQEEFGLERLVAEWQNGFSSPNDAAETIMAKVKTFAGDEPQADDQTIIVFGRNPEQ